MSAAHASWNPEVMVNLARYPINRPSDAAYSALVNHCRKQLKALGAVEIPEFLEQDALQAMVIEADQLDQHAYHNVVVGNAYLEPIAEDLPNDHVKRITEKTSLAVVAYDQFPQTSPLKALYEWDPLMSFIAACLSEERMYRYADPMGALNLSIMREHDYLRWHFDQTDFVTSIALQSSEGGGEFEYIPKIRSSDQENFGEVAKVLNGDRSRVKFFPMVPGTLLLFQGRYAIHRVTKVMGSKKRHVALLGFDTKPGVKSTEHLQRMRYGRISQASGPRGSV